MSQLLDLIRHTKVYQEALEEGKQLGVEEGKQLGVEEGKQLGVEQAKLETIPRMLQLGLSLEVIAQSLDLPLSVVQQVAKGQNTTS
ncbi:MAG: hypothetical protein U7123_17130 [Potamolinea sp.]